MKSDRSLNSTPVAGCELDRTLGIKKSTSKTLSKQ